MTSHYDRDILIDYLHGELDPASDAAVLAHLEACADCTAMHDEEASLGEALRAAARAEQLEFPSMVKARVWDAVRHEQPSWLDRLRAWGPRLAVPVAAAIALGAYLGAPVWRNPAQPAGIEAAYFLDEHNAEQQQNPFGPGAGPAVYATDAQGRPSSAASYIDTADAAILDDASGAFQ
ncbi:MAG TPA: zf-HC2 domain-containing protein [Candidatus Elarobacter sp.]|jgi:anti-sigma factor RsiW|nr:zf-HC2 domain-containing protein [Candidatus Elarobacter sp.]